MTTNELAFIKKVKTAFVHAIIVLTALLSPYTMAASFDCGKASTYVENRVCANELLSSLDVQMAQSYFQALDIRSTTRHEQREWLRNTRNNCTSDSCLISTYQERIYSLKAQILGRSGESGSTPSQPTTQPAQASYTQNKPTPTLGGFGLGDVFSRSSDFESDYFNESSFEYRGNTAPFDEAAIRTVTTTSNVKKIKTIRFDKEFRGIEREDVIGFFEHIRNKLASKYGKFPTRYYQHGTVSDRSYADWIRAINNDPLPNVEQTIPKRTPILRIPQHP